MTIVVAYTPDEAGHAALNLAIAEAKLRGQKLIVVNATRGDALLDTRYAAGTQVEAVDQVLARADVPHEIKQPMGADIADLILDEVDASDATMIVVGLRRRTPVGKLIMGSVSQRLLLDAGVPVFAVRP